MRSCDPTLPTDSKDYDVLAKAAYRTRELPGLSIEIGLRQGGGTAVIMKQLTPGSTHIAVDPYGDIPYHMSETCVQRGYYQNAMRDEAVPKVFALARSLGVNFLYFNMEDEEFYDRFFEDVPVYLDGLKKHCGVYKLVHVDGQHSLDATVNAFHFFGGSRTLVGGEIVFDDVNAYDHAALHGIIMNPLKSRRWEQVDESADRRVYRRIR